MGSPVKDQLVTADSNKDKAGGGGYPNNVANTQTKKMRGTGAATKGTHYSKNSD